MKKWPAKVHLLSVAVAAFCACNNYDLDNRIRNSSSSGGSSSGSGVTVSGTTTGGTYVNGAFNYTLSNSVKLISQISLNGSSTGLTVDTTSLPSFISASISGGGQLQVATVSNPMALPPLLLPSSLNPSIRIISGSGAEARVPLNLGLKRAFVSSLTSLENLTGGTGFVGGCTTGTAIDKLNCGCQNRALAAALPNAAKYRAWVSYDGGSPITAMCNIAQKPSGPTLSIGAVLITNPGSGYTSSPTITFGGCGGATGQVATTTVQNGQLVDVTITNPGTCPTATPATASPAGGGGSGAVVTAIRGACNIKPFDGGPWFTTQSQPQLISYDMGAQNGASLLNANPLASPINFTEFGVASNTTPYTGTNANGEYTINGNCTQWTTFGTGCGQLGNSNSTTTSWTANITGGLAAVGQANTFYCFEGD